MIGTTAIRRPAAGPARPTQGLAVHDGDDGQETGLLRYILEQLPRAGGIGTARRELEG